MSNISAVAFVKGCGIPQVKTATVAALKNGQLQLTGLGQLSKSQKVAFDAIVKAENLDLSKISASEISRSKIADSQVVADIGDLAKQFDDLVDKINAKLEAKYGKKLGYRYQPYRRILG